MTNKKVIVIDDEINIRRSIKACLLPEGYDSVDFAEPVTALNDMQQNFYDVAIIDIRLGRDSGIELFQQMREQKIDLPVIFISGNGSLDEAAQSLKLGAFDFLEKPFNADKLLITVKNCIEFNELRSRLNTLQQSQQQEQLLGEHPLMQQLRRDITKVAASDAAIFICGESGTGKELIAQSLHQHSRRVKGPLVKVNCSAIPENLIESVLFGHIKGAFTGAEQHKKGFFEMANQGTLFLDEIADMSLSAQASLLRALENKEIQKVGSDKVTKVDVRLLAASHKDLKQLVSQGLFREDLFYRINVIPLKSPSLRERASDIPLLVNHFIKLLCQRNGCATKTIDPKCYALLSRYTWPGNIRELLNTVERMVIMGGTKLMPTDIPDEIAAKKQPLLINNEDLSLKEFRQLMERELLIKKLKQYQGNITQVAKVLLIDRSYLHKKLVEYKIKRNQHFD